MKMYDWVEVPLQEFFKWMVGGLFHASTDLPSYKDHPVTNFYKAWWRDPQHGRFTP